MDARVRYTRMAIKNSFVELLRDKPVNKITVTGICELAQINRATFYKYYTDPFDLLKQIEAELLLELNEFIKHTSSSNLMHSIKTVLTEIQRSSDTFKVLISPNGNSGFIGQVLMLCYQSNLSVLDNQFPGLSNAQKKWFYYFLAEGVCGIIQQWVADDMKESPDEVAEFISRLNDILLRELQVPS
ncbi:MAG: TetR/AcrR family transcriptional regulator [Suipraeoptans sp.]